MRVAVIGVGHVGLVSAACFAAWGHDVVGVDDDHARILGLQQGVLPFYEPGLDALVEQGRAVGRLRFVTSLPEAIAGVELAFVCVGTPSLPGGGPNLSFVEEVGRSVAAHATGPLVLVEKSTVPVSTAERLAQVIEREHHDRPDAPRIDVASNPEFLREGTAVRDTLAPDRVVIGGGQRATQALLELYRPLLDATGTPVLTVDVRTAELIKHASNAFLALKISYVNAVARICDLTGADVEQVARGMGLDARIGPHFLQAGLGYGGSCFPKDVDAFAHLAKQVGYDFALLDEVRRINDGQREQVLAKLRDELWHLEGKTIALLGAAFKPGTDDLRESPALHLARDLLESGASVRIYDPVALPGVRRALPEAQTADDPLAAAAGAHAAVVCTEWPEVVEVDLAALAAALAYPVVIDGRNALDPAAARRAGLRYQGMGRGASA